jgi:hypothetical protein
VFLTCYVTTLTIGHRKGIQLGRIQREETVTSSTSKACLLGGALGSALAIFIASSMTVLAGEGNPNYLGILSSTAPSGYTPSPASYSVGSTLTFQFTVTNLTAQAQSMGLQLNVNHITTYPVNGQRLDISNGQPGVANGAVVDGQFSEQLSTEVQDPKPTVTAFSIAPSATQTLHLSRSLGQCGYYQVDVAKAGLTTQKGLIGFEIRVLGCSPPPATASPSATPSAGPSPTPSASPSSTPSPTGGPSGSPGPSPSGGVASPSASPTGGVLAGTGSTPPTEVLALLLVGIGVLALIAGFVALRRRAS